MMAGGSWAQGPSGQVDQQSSVQEHIKTLEREIKAGLKKVKRHSTVEEVSHKINLLERQRSRQTLSLADEKAMVRQVQQLSTELRNLEQIETLQRQLQVLLPKRDNNSYTRPAPNGNYHGTGVTNTTQPNFRQDLAQRISRSKGGAVITADMLVDVHETIPLDRIGQFVGKQGANLSRLEDLHGVAMDVNSDGTITISGVQEDVYAASQSVEQFRSEIIELIPITPPQLKRLKSSRGSHLKNIESLLGVSLMVSVPDGDESRAMLKVRGQPKAVQGAKAAVLEICEATEYMQLAQNGGLMRALFAQGGAELHAIEEKFAVNLHIFRDEGHLSVTGSRVQVDKAVRKLEELAEIVEDAVEVMDLGDTEILSVVIGKRGATVRRIQSETGVVINVSKPSDDGTHKPTVEIRGPRGQVALARTEIEKVLRQFAKENVTLSCPEEYHTALYGPGGSVIKRIQDESGATVVLQRRETRQDGVINVFIRGAEDAVQRAKTAVNALIDSLASDEIPIPEQARAALIGQRGVVISKMQDCTGANISIVGDKALLRGTTDQVNAARLEIRAALEQFHRENRVMYVLAAHVGALIGKGGSTLHKIREQTKAQVDVSLPGESNNTPPQEHKTDKYGKIITVAHIRVRGDPDQLAAAQEAITHTVGPYLVAEGERNDFREITVAVPSAESTRNLVGRSGETIKGIEASCDVRVNVDRDANFVTIRGKAGEGILEAKAKVKELLEQGVRVEEVITDLPFAVVGVLSSDFAVTRRIFEESKATVKVVDGQVQVVGSTGAVATAKGILSDMVKGLSRETLFISPEHVAALQRDTINVSRLEEQHNVRINMDIGRNVVRIVGHPKKLTAARVGILRLLRFFFPEQVTSVSLPSVVLLPTIVGKQGRNIHQLETEHKVNITLDREGLTCDIVGAETDNVANARKAIQNMVDTWHSENLVMSIHRQAVSSIIGRKGSTIQQIKADSGVQNIDVDGGKCEIRIKGPQESIQKAKELIEAVLARFERENKIISIEPDHIPWVIGKQGSTVSAIQAASGASIRIDQNQVFIHGSEEAIENARERIAQVIADNEQADEQRRLAQEEGRAKAKEERRLAQKREREQQEQERLHEMRQNALLAQSRENEETEMLSNLNLGVAIELDTTAIRHQPRPSQTHSSSGGLLSSHTEANPSNGISGMDVLSMLMGDKPTPPSTSQPPPGFSNPQPPSLTPPPPGFANASLFPSTGFPMDLNSSSFGGYEEQGISLPSMPDVSLQQQQSSSEVIQQGFGNSLGFDLHLAPSDNSFFAYNKSNSAKNEDHSHET
mmetsp:Transcript_19260/g.34273  ORF Transcript_19260/g.34273 Transcript_19260/m.34273 type:complete len:1303 (+) Transcript_19260:422-4330(+)